MPLQLNDEQLAAFELLTGIDPGQLNDVLVAYLKDISGSDSNDPQDLWYATLTGLGLFGSVQDMQLEYWADITGTTGQWNDLYYQWLIDTGGAFGPNVNIQRNNDPGFCNIEPPITDDCAASETYTANDSGFTNPADTWLWSIEPPVAGVVLTDATLQTCTVNTALSDVDVSFNLKVIATDSVSTDTANRTTEFTQNRVDTNVTPVYIGPNITEQFVVQGELLNPINVFPLFTGTNLLFSLEGAWPATVVIDSGTGVVSGTATDPIASYDDLTVRATNSKGFDETNLFTVTIVSSATAPVFDAGPVPDQVWQEDVVIAQLAMSIFFSGTLPITYTIETGALPDGVTMAAAGQINGTPTTDGTGTVSITATNGAGFDTTNVWGWTVWETIVNAITIPAQTFPLDELYTHDMSQYFTGTITDWQLGGSWPAGFAIDGAGVVTGTGTVDEEVFPGLFITADNIYETPVNSNTFTGTTEVTAPEADFYALTPDTANDYIMEGVLIGTGNIVTAHTADLYTPDMNGVYQKYPVDKPVWSDGRVVLIGGAGTDVASVHANDAPAGTPLAEIPYLQYYPAAENEALDSNDLTAATWFPTNVTVAQTEDGLTGESNTATLLTATAGNGIVIGTGVTAASDTHTTAWFLKRSIGSGVIEVSLDNAITWQPVVLTFEFTKFTLDQAAVTNPVIGIRIVTSGDEVIVGNAELHLAKSIEEVRDLGPIFTTTASVATDRIVYTFDGANHNDSIGVMYEEVIFSADGLVSSCRPYINTATSNIGIYTSNTGGRIRSSWDNVRINELTLSFVNLPLRISSVWGDSQQNMNISGVWEVDETFAGFTWTTIFVGNSLIYTASFKMRELKGYIPTTYLEGKDIINDLMAQILTLTAGNSGQDVGYETGSFGTLVPDDPFGYTINSFIERLNDVELIVDGIHAMDIFDTIEIDGVIFDLALADSFVTGGGISTWTWDATALTLVSSTVYPMKVKTA